MRQGAASAASEQRPPAGVAEEKWRLNFLSSEVAFDFGSLLPMIADDGRGVVRAGIQATDPILLYDNNLGSFEIIADIGMGFSQLGRAPGISDDGQIVVFYGDLNAQALGTYPGPGIFASIDKEGSRVIQRIAGLAGNGTLDDFQSFDANARVAVNTTHKSGAHGPSQRAVTVVYIGFDTAGNKGIYTNRLNFFGSGATQFNPNNLDSFTVSSPPTLVVEQGEVIPGMSSTVVDVNIYDPINNRDRGDIVFWVNTTAAQAIVRAHT